MYVVGLNLTDPHKSIFNTACFCIEHQPFIWHIQAATDFAILDLSTRIEERLQRLYQLRQNDRPGDLAIFSFRDRLVGSRMTNCQQHRK